MDKLKRVLALVGVAVLVLCYVMSFVTALMATEDSHNWFVASLAATILIPTVLYGYNIILKLTNQNEQESSMREEAYLRMMKEQIQKEKEKQAAENTSAMQGNLENANVNAATGNAGVQSKITEGQNIDGQQ